MKIYINNMLSRLLITVCILTGLLISCNEDLGNYDYTNINTVKIGYMNSDGKFEEGISSKICDAGSILKISPVLVFSLGEDESMFTFTWYYAANNEWQVLQEGRNLEIEIADPIGTPDKSYTLAYEVVNKKTQIPYRKVFSVKVNNTFNKGIIALCELGNGFDIDQIALSGSGQFTLYKNVLDMFDSELPRQGVKPYDILSFYDQMAPNPYDAQKGKRYSIYILTDQYTTRVKTEDYSWNPSYDISNSVEPNSYLDKEYKQKGKPIVCLQMKYSFNLLTTNSTVYARSLIYLKEPDGKGNWYLCSRYPAWYFYSVPMNDVRPSGGFRYEPAPFAGIGNNGAMYFDADKKIFMYHRFPYGAQELGTQQTYYSDPLPPEGASSSFNFSDPNEGLLYMGEMLGAFYPDALYAILKQADGSFTYIEFEDKKTLSEIVAANNKRYKSIFPASSNIGDAKFFARYPSENTPFLYYVTNDNRVYKADISSINAVISDITSTILANDGYSEITAFKYLLPNSYGLGGLLGAGGIGGNADKALAVATYNPSLGKNEGGKLEFFVLDNQASGNLVRSKYPNKEVGEGEYQIDMSWTGLGKIVGLSFKEM
jgi:hypothetical protein